VSVSPAAVLEDWGGAAAPPRLVTDRENAVYDVRLADGRRAALRLHRSGYRSPAAIEAELAWTSRLAAGGFPCPAPIPTASGGLLARAPDGRLASLVSWVEGRPLADPGEAEMRRLGALVARLHEATDAICAAGEGPDMTACPGWTGETLLGERPVWGAFWENTALTPEERRMLRGVRNEARARLDALAEPDIGPIHADLLPDNVLDDGTRLWIIDFDDSGTGYRGYDLGTALVAHAEGAAYPDLAAAFVAGYTTRRGSAARLTADLPLFTMLRALASCGWVLSRTEEGDPRRRAYADRAVRLAERWMARERV
jgi:Ser/Thr protein kinase RdoA (MazF antagonist)